MKIPATKPINPYASGEHIVRATERIKTGHPSFELEPLLGEGPFDTPPPVLTYLQDPQEGLGDQCNEFLGALGLFLMTHKHVVYDRDQTLCAAKDILLDLNPLLEEYPPTSVDIHKVRLDVLKAALPLMDPQFYKSPIIAFPLNSATPFFVISTILFSPKIRNEFGLSYEDDKCLVYKKGQEDEKSRLDVYLCGIGREFISRLAQKDGIDWEEKFLEKCNETSITASWL